jgi:uncharacterized glyoxalase superfamily protein PhnB
VTGKKAGLIPYLCCKDSAAAMDFYKKAFGAEELFRLQDEGGKIGHATMEILGATFFLSDEWPEGDVSRHADPGQRKVLHLTWREVVRSSIWPDRTARAPGAGSASWPQRPV